MAFDAASAQSDEELLLLYARGEHSAARALTERLAPRILSLSRRMLGDPAEAEDVTQEAMLRLWRQAPNWRRGEAQPGTWLYRVALNLCTDRLRRTRPQPLEPEVELVDDAPRAEAALQQKTRLGALDKALQTLPERQRRAVVLRHIEGLSNPEIAALMEIGVEAVESLTARGKRALAAALAGRKGELGFEDD